MSFSPEPSLFNFPFNRGEHEQDLHEVEVSSKRALQRINLLYEEIMRPRSNNESRNTEHFDERNVLNNILCEEYTNDSPKSQKHYLKSCCTTLKELCLKCDNFISRCSSCNRCNCSDANVLKNKRRERSNNSGRSLHQSSCTNLMNPTVKCTIPKPFSLVSKNYEWLKAKEIKISKLKEELNNKIENELKVKIHTKPVPKTTHLPLYSQMVLNKQKRKADRKEKCLEILSNTKPFDLHYKCKEKSKSASDLTAENVKNFKAKPLPKHILSDKVTEKLKNKEEVRKMLRTERALQIMEQSSSPFSERSIPRSRSMIDISNFTKKSSKDYSKKNISEITKRLYVKKCNETMNSWNEKVMQVDTCKKLGQTQQNLPDKRINRNKVSTTQTMPFLYFPVRMSNAALLRDKQIRLVGEKVASVKVTDMELSAAILDKNLPVSKALTSFLQDLLKDIHSIHFPVERLTSYLENTAI